MRDRERKDGRTEPLGVEELNNKANMPNEGAERERRVRASNRWTEVTGLKWKGESGQNSEGKENRQALLSQSTFCTRVTRAYERTTHAGVIDLPPASLSGPLTE